MTSVASFAHNESNLYANIYADELIEQFDRELDLSNPQFLYSETYSRILAARELIEHSHEGSSNYKSTPLLFITNAQRYASVVETINSMAKNITFQRRAALSKSMKQSVLYPSVGGTGNLTGNTYPKDVWSLTFDDGPHSKRTKIVVDNLYLYGFEATFFMLTSQAKFHRSALNYVLDHNMELALHSYSHQNLVKSDNKELDYEISTAKSDLEDLSSTDISLFRLPYGSGTRSVRIRSLIANQGMIHVFWNVDTLDWKDKNPESIFKRTIKQMKLTPKKSGIILFHDIHAQTVIASELVMKYLSDEKKTVCSVGDVVKYHNDQQQSCL